MGLETATLMTIAAVSAVAGAGVSAYSMYASGENQKEAADYNAEMSKLKAQDALQRGAIEASAKREKAKRVAGAQAESMAMSGVAIDTGTPLALLTETAGLGELDALRSVNNATREAWGYKAQSSLDEYQGRSAASAGLLNAGGTFLGGASNAYFGYRAGMKAAA
ncbi:hypothetical protein [Geobacter sp. SVR]|uniref:hypothetical protein n=1 Tax=Geobacter sp. SVR TaxID=2495594 RepID=UPI00143F0410|nr:hypothetical protein [Geobacter sp. SVR]BCS54785.1 hypothetical protein GSVR_30930 [Geobacter sp. SVR]GCF86407.1 hypothetical protein GSbR_30070 [Geobacter sp. SVR]